LAGKTTIAATPEITVGSSSKGNPPASFKPKKGSIVEELREITENLNIEESSGLTNTTTNEKFNNILEKDFITSCGDVSRNSKTRGDQD
jgi:hypothetical protein